MMDKWEKRFRELLEEHMATYGIKEGRDCPLIEDFIKQEKQKSFKEGYEKGKGER